MPKPFVKKMFILKKWSFLEFGHAWVIKVNSLGMSGQKTKTKFKVCK